MQFLNPGFLALALLGVIPVLLYFFRRRSRTVPVSTLVFFKSLAREHQESAWLRRMKKLISLLLTLAVLLGAIAALARPVVAPRTDDLESVVVLLDRSASMGALDAEGRSRLELAKEEIRTRLSALRETVGVALVTYDARVEIVLPRTLKRRQFLSELERVTTRPVSDNPGEALAVARMIAEIGRPAEIWLCSDSGPVEGAAGGGGEGVAEGSPAEIEMPEGVALRRISLALEEERNVGITAFQVRKIPLEHSGYEAYIQVSAASGNAEKLTAEMEVLLGEAPMQVRSLDLEPGDREGIILPITGAAGQVLRVRVGAQGDCFRSDNEVVAQLPESEPIVVAWITKGSDPFTELALSSIVREGELELWKGGPESWPVDESVDLVIFDGWLPEQWPTDLPAIVINPPGSCGPVRAVKLEGEGVPREDIRVANEGHPLLFRVSSGRVALTQTAVIDSSGSLEPLWFAGNEPVLVAGEVRGQRLAVFGFSPELSERLPLTASYPILIGNAVFWCAEPRMEAAGLRAHRTGDVVDIGDAGAIRWRELRDGRLVDSSVEVAGSLAELDRVGLWSAAEDKGGSALLLSRRETDLSGRNSRAEAGASTADAGGRKGEGGFLRGEMTRALLVAIVLILVLESWLFHRHAVY